MMIGEDRAHVARQPADPEWEKLDKKEQIAELIFQLRDQNGYQMWSDGPSCDVFVTRDGSKDSPAHRLVEIGYDAVPQLIDALSDPRPSRSFGAGRSYSFPEYVLTVGDCANQILSRIAGRSFYQPGDNRMAHDGATQQVEKEARQWYADFLAKGEKQSLIDATARGDKNSPDQGQRLLKDYPDAALPALVAGARAAKDRSVRSSLVHLVGRVPGEPSQAFLLEELRQGPILGPRLAAAQILHKQGSARGRGGHDRPLETTARRSAERRQCTRRAGGVG